MTSRTSSWPEIKTRDLQTELTKRRVWVLALISLGYVCYYILGTILVLVRARRQYESWFSGNAEMNLHDFLVQSTSQIIGRESVVWIFTIMAAILIACVSFFFLYKPQAVDFYLSQPLTRKRQFTNIYLNGIAGYGALTLVFTLIALLLAAVMQAVSLRVTGEIIVNLFRNLLLFFAVYNTVILAILISRTYLTAIIISGIFIFAEPLICLLNSFLKSTYYATYYDLTWIVGARESYSLHFFSPAMNHFMGGRIWSENLTKDLAPFGRVWQYDLVTLIFGLIVGYLAYKAYLNRKAEDIGPGVVHPAIKNVLKLIVAIPMALTAAAMADLILDSAFTGIGVMPVIMLLFVAAVVCLVTDVICSGHLKPALKNVLYIVIASVLAIFAFVVFKKDLTGYDRYIPDADDIETCVMYKDYTYREMVDEECGYVNPTQYYIENMNLTDHEAVSRIASAGLAAKRNNAVVSSENPGQYGYMDGAYINGNDAVVAYKLKNGRYTARAIMIPEDIDASLMDRVIGTDEYRDIIYGLDPAETMIDNKQPSGYLGFDAGYDRTETKADTDAFKEFLKNYREDIKQYDYSLASSEYPIGNVTFASDPQNSGDAYFSLMFEVYGCYTHTIDFLKSHGIYMDGPVSAENITSVDIYMTVYEDDNKNKPVYDCDAVFDDPDDIKRVAEHIVYVTTYDWKIQDNPAGINVSLTNTGDDKSYSSEYYGFIEVGDIPQDMIDVLEDSVVYDYSEYASDTMDYSSPEMAYAR